MTAAIAALPPPVAITCDDDCEAMIARLGVLDRDLARIATAKAEAIAKAAGKAETEATPLQGERAEIEKAVSLYCAANRARLLAAGGKTATFKSGEVAWRKGRDTVEIDETLTDKILAKLKDLGLKHMIKFSEAIVKSAILRQPDKVKGIRGIKIIDGAEEITIKPVSAELADVAGPAATAEAA
jgi:phage host-nuclease inhibitor protein Gam